MLLQDQDYSTRFWSYIEPSDHSNPWETNTCACEMNHIYQGLFTNGSLEPQENECISFDSRGSWSIAWSNLVTIGNLRERPAN